MALILIVEDETTQRFAAKFSLEKAGHKVIEAVDGIEGLAQARARLPDVIACDVVMPRMDGYEFLAALRGDAQLAGIPVLLLTSLAERADVRKGMRSGADDYLTKPFKFAELVEAVQGLVGKRVQRESQAARSALTDLEAAMQSQKNELSLRYEVQLLNELNARWTNKDQANVQLQFADAVLVLVGVFAGPLPASPGFSEADEMRAAYQFARDQLTLFGAQHVLPCGNDILAVFPADVAFQEPGEAVAHAWRATESLVRAVPVQALARGPVSLVQVADPMLGGASTQLVGGSAYLEAQVLRDIARSRGWAVVAAEVLRADLESANALAPGEEGSDAQEPFFRVR
ncbi:response regulator transcription factor [Caenimonas aquaedulcis]|uniref:Response regulator n=1 Tax=Caenimonas aquaedulcis TaxID=2793270 RepID=A0A931H4E4_9BURK|nr:response regulator [Caenimonas aquaedulcis]MBG9388283.1 response regulator [Caenimonas aquaedulcis]